MSFEHIDQIILGHNQFFGVNHLSSSKGAEREAYFKKMSNVVDLIDVSRQFGAEGLMLSTHPNAPLLIQAIGKHSNLMTGLNFYPLLPYISKYVRSSNEKGVVNVILDTLSSAKVEEKFKLILVGGLGVVKKDLLLLLKTLIDVELNIFRKVNVKAVFLHDVLTDLALGLDLKNIFELYIEHIMQSFGAIPAFATKNLPLLVNKFKEYGFERPLVMTHFNKAGFQMNPSKRACENVLNGNEARITAMGTLASGYLKPKEAYEYLFGFPSVESVVVGVSTREHIADTFEAIISCRKRLHLSN
jgi:hypothetical protein